LKRKSISVHNLNIKGLAIQSNTSSMMDSPTSMGGGPGLRSKLSQVLQLKAMNESIAQANAKDQEDRKKSSSPIRKVSAADGDLLLADAKANDDASKQTPQKKSRASYLTKRKSIRHKRNLSEVADIVKSIEPQAIEKNEYNFASIVGDINFIPDDPTKVPEV